MSERMNVRRIAELAKIELSAGEEARLSEEMAGILAMAGQLQALDLQGVAPTQHILPVVNVLRQDDAKPCLAQEEILSAAPARLDGCIAVPRTVE